MIICAKKEQTKEKSAVSLILVNSDLLLSNFDQI